VAFVGIGGAALQSYDQTHRTDDIDVTPEHSEGNLGRLTTALNALDCKLVIDPADDSQDVRLPAGYTHRPKPGPLQRLEPADQHGKLDITFHPSGFPTGYAQLRVRATPHEVAQTSVTVRVAALEDVEHSKRTADRPKDRDYLTRVGRLQPPP
jgi:hypothetical protein